MGHNTKIKAVFSHCFYRCCKTNIAVLIAAFFKIYIMKNLPIDQIIFIIVVVIAGSLQITKWVHAIIIKLASLIARLIYNRFYDNP